MSGLGRVAHFDPKNLDFLIADRIADPTAHHAAILATRQPLVHPVPEAGGRSPTGGARSLVGPPVRSAGNNPGPIAMAAAQRKAIYYYEDAWRGNQGDTPKCTAFSSVTAAADGPVTHPGQNPIVDPNVLYDEIVAIDRSEGRVFDDGATTLASAKALQRRGIIGEYLWGYSIEDFIKAIATGVVILGTDWYDGMDDPNPSDGIIRAKGSIRGGHQFEVNGADLDAAMARIKQTWPLPWGYQGKGDAFLPFEDLALLLATGGDLLMFRELPTSIANPTTAQRVARNLDEIAADIGGTGPSYSPKP
jgi:hypothetical protein